MVTPTAQKFLRPDQSPAVTCAVHLQYRPFQFCLAGGTGEAKATVCKIPFSSQMGRGESVVGPGSHLGCCDGFLLAVPPSLMGASSHLSPLLQSRPVVKCSLDMLFPPLNSLYCFPPAYSRGRGALVWHERLAPSTSHRMIWQQGAPLPLLCPPEWLGCPPQCFLCVVPASVVVPCTSSF